MNYKNIKNTIKSLFPLWEIVSKSKILLNIQRKIKEENYYECIPNYKDLKLEQLETIQKEYLEYKKSFEDKAKISTVGLSILIPITLGLFSFLDKFYTNHSVKYCCTLLIIMFVVFSLFNLIIACVLSLKMIGDLNVYYKMSPKDLTLEDDEKKEITAKCIEHNNIYNLLRNNYVYASYKSLTISMISLMVIFVIIYLPLHAKKEVVDISHLCNEMKISNNNALVIADNLSDIDNNIFELKKHVRKQFNVSDLEREIKKVQSYQRDLLKSINDYEIKINNITEKYNEILENDRIRSLENQNKNDVAGK